MRTCWFFFQNRADLRWALLAIILIGICGCAAGLTTEQQSIVDKIYLSTHQIPNHARRVSLFPEGILEVETTDSQDDYDDGIGERTIIDVRSGQTIWSGALRDGQMLTDTPSPIIVETDEGSHTVLRYDRTGKAIWQTAQSGLFVYGLAEERLGMLLTLSIDTADNQSVQARIRGISLMDGKTRWHADLGGVSLKDDEIGSLWRYQDRPIFSYQGKAFLLLENKAISIAIADGRILAKKPIPLNANISGRGNLIWLPYDNDVIVVAGGHVIRLSDRENRQWYTHIGKNRTVNGALVEGMEVIIAYEGDNKRGVAVLDAHSAKLRWQTSVPTSRGASPKGVAVANDRIVIASYGKIHGFSLKTGAVLFTEKISKHLQQLFHHDNGIVLTGANSIEMRNDATGSLLWAKEDLDSPLTWYYSQRKSSMAAVAASMQAAATISANQSRLYYSSAGHKIGGSYTYDPFTRYQYTKLGSSAAASAAASNLGVAMVGAASASSTGIDRMVSIIVDMQTSEPIRDRAYFLVPVETKVLTGQTNTGKLLMVNLIDGSTSEVPVRKAPMTCIPAVMVDERLGLIIQAYHKFPFCNASRTIDILRLPTRSDP